MSVLNFFQLIGISFCTIYTAILGGICLVFSKKLGFWFCKNLWAKVICKIVGVQIESHNNHQLNEIIKPVIFCANHQSNFDIIALYVALDRPIYFIAKKELKKIPFLGWYMQLAGMIFVDRSNRESAIKSMNNAGKLILKGRNVVTFPEGKRSIDGNIKPFKKGSFFIAKQNNINIIPIAIEGSYRINKPGSFRLKKGIIKINFGRIIESKKFKDIESLKQETKDEIVEIHKEII